MIAEMIIRVSDTDVELVFESNCQICENFTKKWVKIAILGLNLKIDHYEYHQGGASPDDELTCTSCRKRRFRCPCCKGGFRAADRKESCQFTQYETIS